MCCVRNPARSTSGCCLGWLELQGAAPAGMQSLQRKIRGNKFVKLDKQIASTSYLKPKLKQNRREKKHFFKGCAVYKLWVLVSELGHMEGDGVGVLGLGVCRGLRAEFRLFRTVFGEAEVARECGAVAPRKPVENETEENNEANRSAVVPSKRAAIFQANHTLR